MFREAGLNITIEANMNTVDFLDITLNLDADTYEPYTKPNYIIQNGLRDMAKGHL